MSIFEQASRLKLRIETSKGQLSAEDLWDLPLSSTTGKANLNDIAKALHRKLKNSDEISFVDAVVSTDTATQLSFDLVKHVIDVRLAENSAAAVIRDNREKRNKIMEILARKEDESLLSASSEDLRAMLASLQNVTA